MTAKPVGLSHDLPPGRVMRAEVAGHDLVVWRATDGTIAAWDNRCPHRGMALSHGFVRGNTLACLYHGWHYGSSGRCAYIPAHPDLAPPETIHTRQHGVTEAGGVIWVSLETAPKVEDTELTPLRSFIIDAPEAAVAQACLETPFEGSQAVAQSKEQYRFGELRLAVLGNPVADGTQATVLTEPGLGLPRRRALSRWCEAMRRRAESEAA